MKIDFNCYIYINVSLNQLFFFMIQWLDFCTYKVLVVERSDRLHVHLQQRQDRFQLISRMRLYELRLYNWILVGR